MSRVAPTIATPQRRHLKALILPIPPTEKIDAQRLILRPADIARLSDKPAPSKAAQSSLSSSRSAASHQRNPSTSSTSSSSVDSLSLTSTSTFPAAYTAATPSCASPTKQPSRRSVSSSCIPSPNKAASPSHARSSTAHASPLQHHPGTPLRSSSPPPSPPSPSTPLQPCRAILPPTQRKEDRDAARLRDAQEKKEREGGEHGTKAATRDEGEEESEELTNTTLADASLPSDDDDDEDRRRRQRDGGAGGQGAGGAGGDDEDEDDELDDTQRGVNAIISFIIEFIQSHSSPPLTHAYLASLSPQQLLASYKSHLAPFLSAPTEVAALRAEAVALKTAVKEADAAGIAECARQVKKAKEEGDERVAAEVRKAKEKAEQAAERKVKKARKKKDATLNLTQHSLSYIKPSTSINQSLSFHETSYDPTLSLTTDMLEPRTVTFTLSTHDLPSPSTSSPASHVLLALFSSSFSQHSLFSYIGQTERRPYATHINFERPLTMREVRTWHAKDTLRVSAYDVMAKGGEEEKDQMGQVQCDTYGLFTAFTQQRITWELLKAQEAVDAVLGYSERRIECSMAGGGKIGIHAIITPALTVDAYPPCPKGIKRSAMSLAVDTSLSMSLNESNPNLSSSLAAISFADPVSPILPIKGAKKSINDTTRRESEGAASKQVQATGTQSDEVHADEQGTQTDKTVVVQKVMVDAGTMTEAAPAPCVLAPSVQPSVSIDPALKIITETQEHSTSDHDQLSPAHSIASGSTPSSPHATSTTCSTPSTATTPSIPAVQATLVTLSAALSVPFPNAHLKLSPASLNSLQRIVALLRRQYASSLQWFLDTSSSAASKASAQRKPIWNPSINPASSLHPKISSTIRLHSHWQPDHSATACNVCTSPFGLLKRKHHCRLCGMMACDECTRKSVELSEVGLPGPQRVCDVCEMIWSVGKGLKTVGDKENTQPAKEPTPYLAPSSTSLTTKPVKPVPDLKTVDEEALHPAPSLTTPSLARTKKVLTASTKKRLVDDSKDMKRITRSAAAKENVHVNVPPTPLESRRKRVGMTPAKGAKA